MEYKIYKYYKIQQDVGATAIEYGLIAALISVFSIIGMSVVGVNLSNTYCTVSKHLGGSGICSGPTSGGSTQGNNGVVNSTNSYAKGATINEVNGSLKEKLDLTYVPSLYGGDDYAGRQTFKTWVNDEVPTYEKYLSDINATDPVTNVFGAYDINSNTPITDYNTIMSDLQNGGSTIKTGSNNNGNSIEVTTASGKVYTLQAGSNGKVYQTENAPLD